MTQGHFDLLTVGTAFCDIVLTGLDGLPALGQEVHAGGGGMFVGGGAVSTGIGAARLGLRTALVTHLSGDALGQFLRAELVAAGIDLRWVTPIDAATPITVSLAAADERTMVTLRGHHPPLDDLLPPAARGAARYLHIVDLTLSEASLRAARAGGQCLTFDIGWDAVEREPEHVRAHLPLVDYFLPSFAEARALSQEATPEGCARSLAALGPVVVVKLGAQGCLVCADGEVRRVPAFPVRPQDTTGAGDAFDAAFVFALSIGLSLPEALEVANAGAALSTTRPGAITAFPNPGGLVAFLRAQGRGSLAERLAGRPEAVGG
jgi:sugar/nucleoside kinase (ribokinase family)